MRHSYELAEGPADYEEADPYLDESFDEDVDWVEESADLAEVLRDALRDEYADASPEEMDDSLANLFDSMSPAESFNFAKALQQIERGAGQILSDPAFGQIARTALPIAGGAIGTAIGGPAGTALGTSLGTAAASALPGRKYPSLLPAARTPQPPPAAPAPAVAGGSAAAAQGLILTQQPDVLKSLLALAMGQHGQRSVNGVPVGAIMRMLSSVFGQAAADADELMYLDQEGPGDGWDGDAFLDDSALAPDRSIYTRLMDAENDELAEAVGAL